MARMWWLLLTTLVLVPLETAAQTPAPRHTDPVVVTATKVETPQGRLGASVTVIDGREGGTGAEIHESGDLFPEPSLRTLSRKKE